MIFIKNNYLLWLSLVTAVLSMLFFNFNSSFDFKDLPNAWNVTHYAINYFDFGFVKRGVVGSLYNALFDGITQVNLFIFQFAILLSVVVVSHIYFYNLGINKSFIYLIYIISPATIMQFGSDFGRFDAILVCFFMLACLYRNNMLLFFAFSLLGVLTHEVYIFTFLPASFLILLHDQDKFASLPSIGLNLVKRPVFYFVILSLVAIIAFGKYENGFEDILNQFYNNGVGADYLATYKNQNFSSLHIWSRSIFDNLEFTAFKFSLNIITLYMLGVYIAVLIYFYFLGVDYSKPNYYLILLSSLPIFVLGTDWGRWISLIYIALFVVFITTETKKAENISSKLFLLFSIYGPLGVKGFLTPLQLKLLPCEEGIDLKICLQMMTDSTHQLLTGL